MVRGGVGVGHVQGPEEAVVDTGGHAVDRTCDVQIVQKEARKMRIWMLPLSPSYISLPRRVPATRSSIIKIEWISAASSQGNRHRLPRLKNFRPISLSDRCSWSAVHLSLSSMNRRMPSDLRYPTAMTPHPTSPESTARSCDDPLPIFFKFCVV